MSSLRQTGIECHTAYLEPKNKPPKALIGQRVIGEALPPWLLYAYLAQSPDERNATVPKTTREAAKTGVGVGGWGGRTGVAKSGHADSGTEWQLTASKETKTIQKAQLPRTAHFKVLLYSRIHMQWGKGFPHIPLIFPDHLISSQHICSEIQSIRVGKDLRDDLVKCPPLMNTRDKQDPDMMSYWTPITLLVRGQTGHRTQASWVTHGPRKALSCLAVLYFCAYVIACVHLGEKPNQTNWLKA